MDIESIDVAILAGGLGTRLRDVLPAAPKVLAPVNGRPFLAHLLDRLAAQGARRVVLCLGYRAQDVTDYLAANSFAPLATHSVVEPEPLGTGGAVAFARPWLASDPVMVLNGDTFVEADLNQFLRSHRASGAEASILCAHVPDAGRYGKIEIDSHDRLVRFEEKGAAGPAWINAGFYLFGSRAMDRIGALHKGSLERDVLEKMPPGSIHAFRADGRFLDIGTPATLALAPEVLPS